MPATKTSKKTKRGRPKKSFIRVKAEVVEVPSSGLATIKDACAFLSLGKSIVYELINAGELKTTHIGRAVRLHWESLREFAKNGPKRQTSVAS